MKRDPQVLCTLGNLIAERFIVSWMLTIVLLVAALAPVGIVILGIRDGFFRRLRRAAGTDSPARSDSTDSGWDAFGGDSLFWIHHTGSHDGSGSGGGVSDNTPCSSDRRQKRWPL
jgi:hypothetical protein